MYALVLVEHRVKALDKFFTYNIPDTLNVVKGSKVKVPFGNTIINGIVLDIKSDTDVSDVKDIIDVVDSDLILSEELLELGKYLKENTVSSLMSIYQAMFPSSLKVSINKKTNYDKYEEFVVLNKSIFEVKKYIEENSRNKAQIEILNLIIDKEKVLKKELKLASLKKLIELDLVKIERVLKYRINVKNSVLEKKKLTEEQESVVNSVNLSIHNTYLLHGVTGSGKTEVYMSLIEKCISLGKKALVLVPEISLTTQIVKRFYNRFSSNVAILHSALSSGEKYDEYKKIIRGG